ncbi:KTSC domain-containing protein [Amycolatopsis sacchari]|uniref:KTSC domain-containing protein n=1 Tax=Amycolatopsis sacchari TaxID=115433 RepID=UPI001FE91B8D|nr:KTSC domain-containing protein [Amycolatopsis sacchari]
MKHRRRTRIVRWPVSSSVIKTVGYDPARRILDVEFHNEHVYRYDDVDNATFAEFMAAESKGRYFNEHIQHGYEYERLL